MNTVLAEKPSVARDIARVLGAKARQKDHYEGNGWRVTWALGHLLQIPNPEVLNPAWARRSADCLPMLPAVWRYEPRDRMAQHLRAVSRMLADAKLVVCATDAGREGEHIFRLIYQHSRSKAQVKRLWVSSLTEEAIKAGFERLQPGSAFDGLAAAARVRDRADWLIGMNASRAYAYLNGVTRCPVGRVQTPTLALVVRRQREIEAFVSIPYAEIEVILEPGFRARLLANGKPRIDDLRKAQAIVAEIAPLKAATVATLDTREVRSASPPLFDLLALTKEANRRWGYTGARVLKIAQQLYEEKHITYPRTECRHLSTDMVPHLARHVAALAVDYQEAARMAAEALSPGLKLGKAYVDDTKLTDHHAIIPTTDVPTAHLETSQKNIYDLIARRFLAIFLPPSVTEETVATFTLGTHTLRATGSLLRAPGWTLLETPRPEEDAPPNDDKDDQALPRLTVGQHLPKRDARALEKKTSPPKPYNDGTLQDAMKLAGRLLPDELLAAFMKQNGLGTPATRAPIIEKLVADGYLERKKRALLATPQGIALVDQVEPELKDPVLTAEWEQQLVSITDGVSHPDNFEKEIVSFVKHLIPRILRGVPMSETAKESLGPCPKCQTGSVHKTPKGWGCSRYKETGCDFVIWESMAGKNLTQTVARELVKTGVTAKPIDGFVSKNKEKFSAKLRLDERHKATFHFEERAPGQELGPCPACKEGVVRATPKGWGCSRYREGCTLNIWREYFGKTLAEPIAREILTTGGTSEPLEGLVTKDGKKHFSARLRFDDRWRVEPIFEDHQADQGA
jgi:DNA topoisomerase-3